MKKMINDILNMVNLPNVQFADIRFTDSDMESIAFERGILKGFDKTKDVRKLGIRVFIDGCCGFSATSDLSKLSIEKTVKKAIYNAETGARYKREGEAFEKIDPVVLSYIYKPKKDPFHIPGEEKIRVLSDIAKKLMQNGIVHSHISVSYYRQYKIYANTEGAFVDTLNYSVMPDMSVISSDGKSVQQRTYPGHMSARVGGWEKFEEMDFLGNCDKIIKESIDLLSAPYVEEDRSDIIIANSQLALQLHESVGHATEADRIFGMEISYAGKTFIKPEMIGNFKYGSDILTIYSDASDKAGIGYHPVDDEGVPSKRVDIIKNGVLKDMQTSRFISQKLGLAPSSNMKASSAGDIPLVRMTNLCIEPVSGSLKDLIKNTENGYLIDFTKTWSIDDNRNNFQFTTEIGWKIKDGEIKHIVKEPTYFGITKGFWNSCDAICGKEEWEYHGTFYCGKGEPGQLMKLSHGIAPARFRNVDMLKL